MNLFNPLYCSLDEQKEPADELQHIEESSDHGDVEVGDDDSASNR